MWIGSDVKAIDVDGDGELRFNAAKNEKFTGIVEKVANQVKIDGLFCNSYKYFSDISTNSDIQRRGGQQYFSDGKALFKIGGLGEIQTLRNMEADFGLVPLPSMTKIRRSTEPERLTAGSTMSRRSVISI